MASQTTQLAIGALVAVGIGVVTIVAVETQNPRADAEQTAATQAVEPVAVESAEPVTEVAAVPAKPKVPAFDTFRVEGDGLFVIAGKAEAGQTVDVMLSGEPVERVVADANGSFGAVLVLDPSEDARRLVLLADPEGAAVASDESFLVEPFAAVPVVNDTPAVPAVIGAVSTETAAEVRAAIEIELPDAPAIQSSTGDLASPEIDTATVLVADSSGVRVVTTDRSVAPEITSNIALDTITYDPLGEIEIAGRASGAGFVQVYIDNQPVTTSRISETGGWRTELPEVDTGIYTLRVDEVDDAGTVVSRIETPFKREDSETVAAVLAEDTAQDGFDVAVRTVQPGATLWAIAQEELGSGVLYVAVYEANRDLIRDPDLIYPGQVFRVPEVTE